VSGNNRQDKNQDTDDTNEHNNQFPKQGYTQSHYRESENCQCGERETVEHYILHCDQYEEAREKLIHDMFLLSASMHLSLEVLLTVEADEEASLMGTERIRRLADYIQETKRFDFCLEIHEGFLFLLDDGNCGRIFLYY
jgi:hypothetical protein